MLPVHISADIRSGVIRHWLMGDSRDEIASKFLISTGAVTNIVNEWRNNVSSFVADDLRELSLSLKKAQISPLECGTGLRIGKMMQRFGINEEQFEYFMTEIYNKCQLLEIAPEQIGKYLAETVNMSEIVFPSQIPNYINTKKVEIEELEKQIENKHETISQLNKDISNLEEKQESLIENNNISLDAINWYKDVKEEITSMGIPFDDVSFFVDCLRGIRNQGYDVNKIVTKSSELINFSKFMENQEEIKRIKINEIEQLKNTQKELEKQIDFIQLKLSINEELKNIGMGFKELKTIYNTIIEISKVNNISPKEAIEMFFNDLNEYDNIVSFKKKVGDLKKEVFTLNLQITNNRIIHMSQQHIGDILQRLLRIGISEKDIEDINSILSLGEFEYYDNNSNKIIINKQSLI
ncbi:MAG TPA: hypothetical protein VHJ38_04210, partial [Nitrososphaeraceae archaeon]|nr:hypothetical protein [Nitrososphaeraceae archaeon]